MSTEAFPEVHRIEYEGPDTQNPLAFRKYEADRVIDGVTMREHLKFACAYWHSKKQYPKLNTDWLYWTVATGTQR